MRLFVASVFVIGLLFTMLFTLIMTFFYYIGWVPWYLLIGITVVLNFLVWLVGPYISDWIFRVFYKLRWIGIDGLEEMDKGIADFVRDVCKRNKIKIPKIGYIDDDNPTSFTYGSAAFNARIVFTQGIFTYLEPKEVKSVLAHELGHVVHRDFIVLTIAAVFVQIFYQLYRIGIESGGRGSGGRGSSGKKEGGSAAFILAVVGYVFYVVGNYIVLYLSRVREYYADEFAAEQTQDPNALSSALIKIAYGIIKNPEKKRQLHLLKSTRSQNIFDFKIAKRMGLAYANVASSQNWKPVEGALLYDRYNPWAFVAEMSSTHPMTGKRIGRLCSIAKRLGKRPMFDMQSLYDKYMVDKARLYKNFGRDLFFLYLPLLMFVFMPLLYAAVATNVFTQLSAEFLIMHAINIGGLSILGLGIGYLLKTMYSYSYSYSKSAAGGFPETTIADMMGDIYTSPIRGRPGKLKGKIIGKGIPGFIFSEDMMFQDDTGIIYINYEGLLPLVSNLIFSLTKVKKLVGKKCTIDGWFVRSIYQMIHLREIHVDGGVVKSRVRFLGIISSMLLIILGSIIFVLGLMYLNSLGHLSIPILFLS